MLRFLLFAASAAPAFAFAQAAPPPSPVSPVVVTATRIPTPLDKVGSAITLIDARQIAVHQWRTLPEALGATPGLNVVQTGGPGGLTSVFIRGANSNHTEVIIDGIDVTDPSQNGAYDFGQGLTAGAARIEVLRGPQSSLYGADALGGVIAVVTPEGEGRPAFAASLEAGTFATTEETASVSGSAGRARFALGLAHLRVGDSPTTPARLLAPGETAIGDRLDNTTLTAKLGYDLTPAVSLRGSLRYVDSHYRSTGENYDLAQPIPDAAQTSQWERQFFARLEASVVTDEERFDNRFGLNFARFDTRIEAPDDGAGLGLPPPAPIHDAAQRLGADWQGRFDLTKNEILVFGADVVGERLYDVAAAASETRGGAFIEWQARPLPALSVAASLRVDDDARYGAALTWRVAPAWRIAATHTLFKASIGTGFKAPTLAEQFIDFPEFGFFANPALKPERSLGYDLGFEQPLISGRLSFGATGFHNAITNLIEPGPDSAAGPFAETWLNIGKATTYGVESFIAARPTQSLGLRADYTWLMARDDLTGAALLRRPKTKVSLTADWQATRRLRLGASLIRVGAWRDFDRSGSFVTPGEPFTTVDVSADYDVGHGLTLFGKVTNLFDRRYESPVGFAKPGIGAVIGVRAAWRP